MKKNLLPYVKELMIYFLVFCLLCLSLTVSKTITFHWSPLLIPTIILLVLWLIFTQIPLVIADFRALLDWIFNNRLDVTGCVIAQLEHQASAFYPTTSTVSFKKVERAPESYQYTLVIDTGDHLIMLKSPIYPNVEIGTRYTFTICKKSSVILKMATSE